MYNSRSCTGHKSGLASNLGKKKSFIDLPFLDCLGSIVGRKAHTSVVDLWAEIFSFSRSTRAR